MAENSSITLVGGQTQVTLIGGTGEDSILSGHILTVYDTDTLIGDGNATLTISADGGISTTGGDADVTVIGGELNSSIHAEVTSINAESISLGLEESGNGYPGRSLKRMELIYKDTVIKFAINPSDYTQKEPNRATITQTQGGAWIDAWGAGVVEFNIKGITGVSGSPSIIKNVDVGYQRWKEFRDLFRQIYQDIQNGEPVTEFVKFYNYTDNEFWYCYPTQNGIELYRSRSKPHVYQYNISLWGIRRIGEPETTVGVIGNPNKETTTISVDNSDSENIAEGAVATINNFPEDAEIGENYNNSGNNFNQNEDTHTIQDSTATIVGGNAYVTKNMPPDVQADAVVVTNTRTKTNAVIRDQCSTYAQELAPLIGGHNGQLSPKTAYNCAKDIFITDTGVVLNVNGFDAKTLNSDHTTKFHRLMEETIFTTLVSRETYTLQQQILSYSPDVLSPEYILPIGSTPRERVIQAVKRSTKLDSTLYYLITKYQPKYYLSKKDVYYLKIVMLETMMVYCQLYQIAGSEGRISTHLTPNNMKTLIKNLDALIIYLELNATDNNEFFVRNIMWELRKIEYILVQVAADIVEYL